MTIDKKVVFKTYYEKPIYEGDSYHAVMADNSIIKHTATLQDNEIGIIRTRFQSLSGAEKFVKKNPITSKKAPKAVAIQEEQKAIKAIDEYSEFVKDLRLCDSTKKFDQFSSKYNLSITTRLHTIDIKVRISGKIVSVLSLNADYTNGTCCAHSEHNSHEGTLNQEFIKKGFRENEIELLIKYIVHNFDKHLLGDFPGKGIVTYIRNPLSIMTDPSARWGLVFKHSKYFDLVSTFCNVKDSDMNTLDMYTINKLYGSKFNADDYEEEDYNEED